MQDREHERVNTCKIEYKQEVRQPGLSENIQKRMHAKRRGANAREK